MKKIRVVHDAKTVGYAGTERTAQLICKHLNKEKFDVYLAYREGSASPRLSIMQDILGKDKVVAYEYTNGDNVSPYYPKSQGLTKLLQELDPDIYHVHRSGYSEWPIVPAVKTAVPRTKFVETNIFGHQDPLGVLDCSIYICEYIRQRANAHFLAPVIYNPTEGPEEVYDNFIELRTASLKFRDKIGLKPDSIVLGRIGRPDVFCDISLNAIQRLSSKPYFNRLIYLIINGGDRWAEKAALLGITDNCIFLPPIYGDKELSQFYDSIHILAHARHDGECNSCCINEAMIHGVPVVTHSVPPQFYNGHLEQLANGGGFVVDGYDDVDTYANHLDRLITDNNLYEGVSREAALRAQETCSIKVTISKTEDLYMKLVEG